MKKYNLYFLMVISIIFSSCAEEFINDNGTSEDVPNGKKELKALTYDTPSTTNVGLNTNWESFYEIKLNNGLPTLAPWINESGSHIDIPLSYRQDIKKEEGWVMQHTMVREWSEPNYMIFYNKNRGLLKVFYYNPSHVPNQSLVWVVEANNPTSVLPTNELIQGPLNTTYQYSTASNLINNSITNFGQLVQGWNMFTLDLPYGQTNNSPVISIRAYNSQSSSIQLGGTFSGEITINIPQESSDFLTEVKNLIDIIPKFSKGSWIDKFYNVPGAVGFLGKLGSSSLFTSKSGDMILKGTTSGEIKLTGNSFTNIGGTVTSLTNIDLKRINDNKLLGLWNLTETPTFSYNKYSLTGLDRDRKYTFPLELNYIGNTLSNAMTINPEIRDQISSYGASVNSFFTQDEPYIYESDKIANKVYDLARKYYSKTAIMLTGSEPYIEPGGSHPFDFILVAEHTISQNLYANITAYFKFKDGSSFESTRNYKIKTIPYDNWVDINNKTRPYDRVEYIKIW